MKRQSTHMQTRHDLAGSMTAETAVQTPVNIHVSSLVVLGPDQGQGQTVTGCVQAALDAFEAESYHDLVGVPSTMCVAGIEDSEMANREEFLKSIVPGGPSGPASPTNEAAAEPVQVEEDEEGDESDDVEGDSRKLPNSDVELVVAKRKGRKIGVKGRVFEVEPNLWNVVSPTGEAALPQQAPAAVDLIHLPTRRASHSMCICPLSASKLHSCAMHSLSARACGARPRCLPRVSCWAQPDHSSC